MDKKKIENIVEELLNLTKNIESKYNIKFDFKGGRISENNAIIKFGVNEKINGKILSKERVDFNTHAKRFGINKSWLDKKFIFQGDYYKVVGIKINSWKYPIVCERTSDGKKFKFTVENVKGRI